ncbi:Uncharacterized protein TCM_044434 [Theobroma cacao]|uniref:Uncharacterized protein n=1 Tax=Theobroma cacao TaxID=3641 RepID=A0A061FR22_THECC|nr:Uncharacterized protein TCM_044434 [Theobroma cacao]
MLNIEGGRHRQYTGLGTKRAIRICAWLTLMPFTALVTFIIKDRKIDCPFLHPNAILELKTQLINSVFIDKIE